MLLLPLLAFAYPVIYGLLSRSQTPEILGRWSKFFFAFNLWNVLLVLAALALWRAGRLWLLTAAYLLVVLTTAVFPANSQLAELPGMALTMPLIRTLCGVAILLAAFLASRGPAGKPHSLGLLLGTLILCVSVLDLALLGLLSLRPSENRSVAGLRVEYDLSRVDGEDVLLVGDSFVWGQGVPVADRMGDRLEARLDGPEVFSLGERGTGLVDYNRMLEELPAGARARSTVIAYYMNDMPAPESAQARAVNLMKSFGKSFPTLRFVADHLAKALTPDVDAYHRFVIGCYDETHPGYELRWQRLAGQVETLSETARTRGREQPLFVILPLMVDFESYPLDDAHRRLGDLAAGAGFEVLDLLPMFRREMTDGVAYRTVPNDNHFNEAAHDRVAEEIQRSLESRAAP
ncbi:hypothetical protein ABI59_04860 [Acidobacteria bacterium Mor1]|nr:hypothetical protein ABI59_04860 [Acidobacteria bacterium Mor1]